MVLGWKHEMVEEWNGKIRQQIFIGTVRIGLKLVGLLGLFYSRTFFVAPFIEGIWRYQL